LFIGCHIFIEFTILCGILKSNEEAEMSIAVEFNDTVASIVLSGGIDYSAQEEFKAANKQALSAIGITEIQVDFAKAEFMDSSGIRALLILKKETDKTGKALVLMNCNTNLLDVFEIGGFNKIFTFR